MPYPDSGYNGLVYSFGGCVNNNLDGCIKSTPIGSIKLIFHYVRFVNFYCGSKVFVYIGFSFTNA